MNAPTPVHSISAPLPYQHQQQTIKTHGHSSSSPTTQKKKSHKPVAPRLAVLQEPRLHQTFRFQAVPGRLLKTHTVGFAEYGSGYPVFVIGGHGCTRLVGVIFEELASRYAVRCIWPERPGYGLSEECQAQHFNALDWAEVIIQLADHLKIKQFSIIAQSVGTVFAMAIAYKYPSRIVGPLFLISPWVSTYAANTFKWSRRLPAALVTRTVSLALDIMWMFTRSSGSPDRSSTEQEEEDDLLASLDNDDDHDLPTDFPPHRPLRHVVRPRHMSLYFAMNEIRTSEPHMQGQLLDVLIALEKYHPFGFSYSEIKTAISAVWGDKDALIPQRAIDALANSLRDVRFKILDGEGHDLVWKEGVMEWAIRGVANHWRLVVAR